MSISLFQTLLDHSDGEHIETSEETYIKAEKEYGFEKAHDAMKVEVNFGLNR